MRQPLCTVSLKSSAFFALLLVTSGVIGCSKDKPKAEETKQAEPTPVPSDMVFNDFLPTTGGNAAGLGVRDAGLEGGLAAVGGGGAGEPGGPGGGPEATGPRLRVLEAGAEPRVVRKYTFVPNRVDKRVISATQSVTQSAGGQSAPAQELTLKLFVDFVPKQVKPAGASIEAKIVKVELPGAPPQAAQMLASMNGLSGSFDVSSHGEVGEISFMANPQMQNQLAENVVQGLSQAAELLVVPLPEAPLGAGAKWEMVAGKGGEQGTKRFTLKEVNNEGGVVEADIDVKVPRRAAEAPGGRGTMFVEVEGKGHYVYNVRFDRMSSKVDGELAQSEKIEVPDSPKGGGRGGPKSITQLLKVKHTIEATK